MRGLAHIGAQLDFLQNLCKFWWIHSIFTKFGEIFVEMFVDSKNFSLMLVNDFSQFCRFFRSIYFHQFCDWWIIHHFNCHLLARLNSCWSRWRFSRLYLQFIKYFTNLGQPSSTLIFTFKETNLVTTKIVTTFGDFF